jgi:hypothetical protein
MALFSLTCIGLVWHLFRLPLLSFPILFLGVTFMYTSSPLILYQFEGLDAFAIWKQLHLESVMRGMPLVMLAFSSFLVGTLLAAKIGKRQPEGAGDIIHTSSGVLWKAGLILYLAVISVIVLFTLRGAALNLVIQSGYRGVSEARQAGEMAGLIGRALERFLPWSLLIMTAASRDRRTYLYTLILALPAFGILFLMGDRWGLLTSMLLMASGSYLLGYRVDWKRSLAIILLVALLVPTMVNLRSIPTKEWSVDLLAQAATNQIEGKPQYGRSFVSATLASTAASYQVLMGTVMLVPDIQPHRYGVDYLRSLSVVLPFSHRLYSALGMDIGEKPSHWFKAEYNPYMFVQLGYLQIAEAYLQFGALGVMGLFVILGMVLIRLWWSMQSNQVESRRLALVLIVTMEIIIWIRGDSTGLLRALVWGWLLVYGLTAVLGELHRLGTRVEGGQKLIAGHRP